MISPHPTWRIIDSTKIMSYLRCPRMFFFEYVLGWRPQGSNIHLHFGDCIHQGMEVIFHRYQQRGDNSHEPEDAAAAFDAFMLAWRKETQAVDDNLYPPKTPANAKRVFEMYCEQFEYKHDFKVHYLEVAGTVPISTAPDPERVLHFKIDMVAEDEQGFFIMDHKTSGSKAGKTDHWNMSFQFRTYVHALKMFIGGATKGRLEVNHIYITDPPKLRKDGQPYANSTDIEFQRIPLEFSTNVMAHWLYNARRIYGDIERNFEALAAAKEEDTVLQAFPTNETACWGCAYLDLCYARANPLQYGTEPPIGYKKEFWNPQEKAEQTAKTRVQNGVLV